MAAPSLGGRVISGLVVLVIVASQLLLIIGMVWLLMLTDRQRRSMSRAELRAVDAIREPLRSFLMGGESGAALARVLAGLHPAIAARQLERLAGTLLAGEQMRALAVLIRHDDWVEAAVAGGASRRWWKRMAAARMLGMVYREGDRPLLARLVMDPKPAVAAAATSAIAAHADRALVEDLVRHLTERPRTVGLQQMHALRRHAEVATPLLVAALASGLSVQQLKIMVEFAEILATPRALAAVVGLASHPDAELRVSVARALRAAFVPGAVAAATRLVHDPDWRVRAAAARALEGLRAKSAIPALGEALRDEQWWVRYRAAVALAGLGDPGRIALEDAIVADDYFARDMAIAVGDLSDANRLDLGG